MKKQCLLLLASVLSFSAQAQTIEPVKTTTVEGNEYNGFIPTQYTCNGKGRVVTKHEDGTASIFDNKLKEEKTFSLINSNLSEYYTLYKTREYVFKDETLKKHTISSYATNYDIIPQGFSLDDFLENHWYALREKYNFIWIREIATYREIAKDENSVTFELGVGDNDAKNDYLSKYQYENVVYPIGKFVFRKVNNAYGGTNIICDIEYTNHEYKRSYSGDWKESKVEGYSLENLIDINCWDVSSPSENIDLMFTQNLFNKDDAYEYVSPLYEYEKSNKESYDRDQDGEIDSIKLDYRAKCVGFQIVQDNGKVLSSVKFGNGYVKEISSNRIKLLHFADDDYLVVNVHDEQYNYATIYYAFTHNNPAASLKAVRTENHGISVNPGIVRQSEVVNVDVSDFKNARQVVVVSSNGQTMMKQQIASGQKNVQLQTMSLPKGMYVVKVSDGKTASDNCKIIVR